VTLTGTIGPSDTDVTWWFEVTDSNGAVTQTTHKTVSAGASSTPVSAPLNGLIPGSTYHYRLFGESLTADGHGSIDSFTTSLSCGSGTSPPGVSAGQVRVGPLRAVFFHPSSVPGANFIVQVGLAGASGYQYQSGPTSLVVHGAFTPGYTYQYRVVAYTNQGTNCATGQTVAEYGLENLSPPRLGGEGTASPVAGKVLTCGGGNSPYNNSSWSYNGNPVPNNGTGSSSLDLQANEPGLTEVWLRDGKTPVGQGAIYGIQPVDDGHWISCVQFADNGWDVQPQGNNIGSAESLAVKITHYGLTAGWLADVKPYYNDIEAFEAGYTSSVAGACIAEVLVVVGTPACFAEIVVGEAASFAVSKLVDLVDPPDSHFQDIALPRAFPFRPGKARCRRAKAARCHRLVKLGARFRSAEARAAPIVEAMFIAGNRFDNARGANDYATMTAQTAARKVYDGMLVPVLRPLQSALRSALKLSIRPGRRWFRHQHLPADLRVRLEHDGINPTAALAQLKRQVKKIGPRRLRAIARKPLPTGPLKGDYQSISLTDIGWLLGALRTQAVLSDAAYGHLEKELTTVQAQCSPAARAAAMVNVKQDLANQIGGGYGAFMQVAVAPLLNADAPGLATPCATG
jgi:hypothetical protein